MTLTRNSVCFFARITLGALILTGGCQKDARESSSSPDATEALRAKEEALLQRELQLAKAERALKDWAERLQEQESSPASSPPPPPALQPQRQFTPMPPIASPTPFEPEPRQEEVHSFGLETVPAAPSEPEPATDNRLLPKRRPQREIRATTASYGGPAKLFGDKLMMRTMRNPQRIPQGRFYVCNFDAFLDARTLKPGDLFGIAVDSRGQANFGPAQEAGGLSDGQWFEAQVLAVRQPAPGKPQDQGGVVFEVKYLVMPEPNGRTNREMAIPVKAVVVSEMRDDRPDFRSREQDSERVWSAVGQMTRGVEGYFYAGAANVLLSKLSDIYIGKDQFEGRRPTEREVKSWMEANIRGGSIAISKFKGTLREVSDVMRLIAERDPKTENPLYSEIIWNNRPEVVIAKLENKGEINLGKRKIDVIATRTADGKRVYVETKNADLTRAFRQPEIELLAKRVSVETLVRYCGPANEAKVNVSREFKELVKDIWLAKSDGRTIEWKANRAPNDLGYALSHYNIALHVYH